MINDLDIIVLTCDLPEHRDGDSHRIVRAGTHGRKVSRLGRWHREGCDRRILWGKRSPTRSADAVIKTKTPYCSLSDTR